MKNLLSNATFQVKKHSPEILLAMGLISAAGTIYMSIKASKKIDTVLSDFEEKKENITDDNGEEVMILPKEEKVEMVKQIVVAAAPAVAMAVFSTSCICGSFGIVNRRLTLVSGALATTTEKLNAYRKNVAEQLGEAAEEKLFRTRKVTEEREDEDGNTIIEEKEILDSDCAGGAHQFFWDSASSQFVHGDELYNKMYLDSMEEKFNRILLSRGHVFLNEVLDSLGIQRTPLGCLVGWTDGGGYIDFGTLKHIDKTDSMGECVLLDFNCHGYIYNLI